MLTTKAVETKGNYEKLFMVSHFNEDTYQHAVTLFSEYKNKGTILNEKFSDHRWQLTDQLHNCTLNFGFNELLFQKNTVGWIGCSYSAFVTGAKMYVAFMLGTISLYSIRNLIGDFERLVSLPNSDLIHKIDEYPGHIIEFLNLLPGDDSARCSIVEILLKKKETYQITKGENHQRILSELSIYFRFSLKLEDFWDKANDGEKLYWFPLYLWWTLTSILPLRPTEFLLTPRNCLTIEHGENTLTLRRTKKKKGLRKTTYSIEGDYEKVRYSITSEMAANISQYVKATGDCEANSFNTLFMKDAHASKSGYSSNRCHDYLTYHRLEKQLASFQMEMMGIESGSMVHLGDTRHLAMIGLILSGGSPLICKELAGHEDINISSHYYTNISSFIECSTFEMHRKSMNQTAEFLERESLPIAMQISKIKVSGGYCCSERYLRGEIVDCIKCIGTKGELGDCKRCPFFIDGTNGTYFLYSKLQDRKKEVDKDSIYLIQAINAVRRGLGYSEDVLDAIHRLQHSGSCYKNALLKNLEER